MLTPTSATCDYCHQGKVSSGHVSVARKSGYQKLLNFKRHLCAAEPARSASSGLHRDGARGEVLRDGAGAHLRQVRLPQRQGHPRAGLPELALLH